MSAVMRCSCRASAGTPLSPSSTPSDSNATCFSTPACTPVSAATVGQAGGQRRSFQCTCLRCFGLLPLLDVQLPWAKRAASGDPLDTKYPYVCHAEMNALLNKNGASGERLGGTNQGREAGAKFACLCILTSRYGVCTRALPLKASA